MTQENYLIKVNFNGDEIEIKMYLYSLRLIQLMQNKKKREEFVDKFHVLIDSLDTCDAFGREKFLAKESYMVKKLAYWKNKILKLKRKNNG